MPYGVFGPSYQRAVEDAALTSAGRNQANRAVRQFENVKRQNVQKWRDYTKSIREKAFGDRDRYRRELMEAETGATFDPKAGRMRFNPDPEGLKQFIKDNPRLTAEMAALAISEPFIKSAAPLALSGATMGMINPVAAQEITNRTVNRPLMNFVLDNAPVSDEAKEAMRGDFTAPGTTTTFIDPALSGLTFATGGSTVVVPALRGAVRGARAAGKGARVVGRAGAAGLREASRQQARGLGSGIPIDDPGTIIRAMINSSKPPGVVKQEPQARALQESEPYDITYNGNDRLVDRRTYEAAEAINPGSLPEPTDVYDDAVRLPKGTNPKNVRQSLKDLAAGFRGQPTAADQINRTATQGVERVNAIYDSEEYASIVSKYGTTRPTITVPKIKKEKLKEMHDAYESDMGDAWSYDPITGDIITTNNEHVFAISPEALRHVFELKQLDKQLDASNLSKKDKAAAVQALLDKQAKEIQTILDPNNAMLILTDYANQRVVGSMDPRDKIRALTERAGGRFIPIPYRAGEQFGAASPLGATLGKYMDIMDSVGAIQPSLVSESARAFRSRYNETVKPIRDSIIRTKDPIAKSRLEAKLIEAEQALGVEFGYV